MGKVKWKTLEEAKITEEYNKLVEDTGGVNSPYFVEGIYQPPEAHYSDPQRAKRLLEVSEKMAETKFELAKKRGSYGKK